MENGIPGVTQKPNFMETENVDGRVVGHSIIVHCPYCYKRHTHGYTGELLHSITYRMSHCKGGDTQPYAIYIVSVHKDACSYIPAKHSGGRYCIACKPKNKKVNLHDDEKETSW